RCDRADAVEDVHHAAAVAAVAPLERGGANAGRYPCRFPARDVGRARDGRSHARAAASRAAGGAVGGRAGARAVDRVAAADVVAGASAGTSGLAPGRIAAAVPRAPGATHMGILRDPCHRAGPLAAPGQRPGASEPGRRTPYLAD